MERRRVLEDDLGFLLTRASAMVVRSVNEALAPLGLRVRPYTVLSLACDEPAGVAQRRIAADMGLDPSQIVAIVDELESRNLVARTADPGDRRNKLVVATDEGRKLCDEARRLSEEVSARHFAGADPALLDEMRKVLGRMVFSESVDAVR
ncbi:MarR family winged helix-turn-helix transcriptional regulator [Rhodococcus indonesiensis]